MTRQWVLYGRKQGGAYDGTWQARGGGSLRHCWRVWREDRQREFDRFRLRRRLVTRRGVVIQ